jgi:hypothetical protein
MSDSSGIRTGGKFCSSCGAVIKKEAEICPKCGVRVLAQGVGAKPHCALASTKAEDTRETVIIGLKSNGWIGNNGQIDTGEPKFDSFVKDALDLIVYESISVPEVLQVINTELDKKGYRVKNNEGGEKWV